MAPSDNIPRRRRMPKATGYSLHPPADVPQTAFTTGQSLGLGAGNTKRKAKDSSDDEAAALKKSKTVGPGNSIYCS